MNVPFHHGPFWVGPFWHGPFWVGPFWSNFWSLLAWSLMAGPFWLVPFGLVPFDPQSAVIMNDLKWISLVILILINLILITCYSYVLMISLDC